MQYKIVKSKYKDFQYAVLFGDGTWLRAKTLDHAKELAELVVKFNQK